MLSDPLKEKLRRVDTLYTFYSDVSQILNLYKGHP